MTIGRKIIIFVFIASCYSCAVKLSPMNQALADLQNNDRLVRAGGAEQLGSYKNDKSVEALAIALQDDDRMVRAGAANSLAMINTHAARAWLIDAAKEEGGSSQDIAISALAGFNDPVTTHLLLDLLVNEKRQVRRAAIVALKNRRGKDIAGRLIEVLDSSDKIVAGYAISILAIQDKTDEITDAFLKQLKNSDVTVRIKAVDAVTGNNDDKTIKALLEALQDKSPHVRVRAIRALDNVAPEHAVDITHFFQMLDDENPNVQFYAIKTIGRYKAKEAIQPLIKTMKNQSNDHMVRSASAIALGESLDPSVFFPLSEAFEHEGWNERIKILQALAILKDDRSINWLLLKLEEFKNSYYMQKEMFSTLAKITGQKFGKNLKAWKEWRTGNPDFKSTRKSNL